MFKLDPAFHQTAFELGKLDLSIVFLNNEARYPWVILVPERDNIVELIDLSIKDRLTLLEESCLVQESLKKLYTGKLNVGYLGNICSQFHLHHIIRNENDPAWPGPVWGHSPAVLFKNDEKDFKVSEMKAILGL